MSEDFEVVIEVPSGKTVGERGIVGQGKTSTNLKRKHQKSGENISLKAFAKTQPEGRDWLKHKAGSLNKKRSEDNVKRVALEAAATRAARRSKKGGNKEPKAA